MRARNHNGFTIVELLVVAAVVGILMSLVSIYFSQQAKVTRDTQALQEARIKARMVAEMVVQDLQTAGSSVFINDRVSPPQTVPVQLGCSAGGEKKCIGKPPSATRIKVSMVYATSLREEPCRRVDYRLNSLNTLQRLEQGKSAANCAQLQADPATSTFNPTALASNILGFSITYMCANDPVDAPPVDDPVTCYAAPKNSFPQQATVTVQARADDLDTVTSDVELTTALPNLRY
ncbi:hypothetical protein BH24DEI2_BH24DEI2_24040 [soil metagenome]